MMATSSLLFKDLDPSEKDIEYKITNLCRCGTYVRIKKAIQRSAELIKNQKG